MIYTFAEIDRSSVDPDWFEALIVRLSPGSTNSETPVSPESPGSAFEGFDQDILLGGVGLPDAEVVIRRHTCRYGVAVEKSGVRPASVTSAGRSRQTTEPDCTLGRNESWR